MAKAKGKKATRGAKANRDGLSALQTRLEETEHKLREARATRERLSREGQATAVQLSQAKAQLEAEQRAHRDEILELERANGAAEAEARGILDRLEDELAETAQTLESYRLVESDHVRLCEQEATHAAELEDERAANASEEDKLRIEAFNMRMQLENVSRKTLRELDAQYVEAGAAGAEGCSPLACCAPPSPPLTPPRFFLSGTPPARPRPWRSSRARPSSRTRSCGRTCTTRAPT